MNEPLNTLLNLFFRWAHVIAGITWIGHLYFFNWVNGPFQAKMDGPTKKAVNPELLPRALFWFRWGAAWTWITGLALSSLVYYETKLFFEKPQEQHWGLPSIVIVLVTFLAFALYDPLMKAIAQPKVQAAVGWVLISLFYLAARLWAGFGFRGAFIHVGMLFGTLMAANVWMRIWPNQRRIITAVKAGEKPDAGMVALAGIRSKHNTYMSVPLIFAMISQHGTWAASGDWSLPVVVALGWLVVMATYKKAAKVPGF
jgi:uncharacterized membrane protein